MIKIAICDDEEKDREKIQEFVEEYMRESREEFELKRFESGEQFLSSGFVPDILFLDIIMDQKDGIQVGTELKRLSRNVLIVYITNAGGKAMQAFNQIHSFGFLNKPVEKIMVFRMMADAIERLEKEQSADTDMVAFLSEKGTIINLHIMDIYYFEYNNRRVKIITRDNIYICREKINDIADRMECYGFAMSHQSFVVNLHYVDKISGSMLIMRNGTQVYLAQKRTAALRKQLMMTARKAIHSGGKD